MNDIRLIDKETGICNVGIGCIDGIIKKVPKLSFRRESANKVWYKKGSCLMICRATILRILTHNTSTILTVIINIIIIEQKFPGVTHGQQLGIDFANP